LVGSRKPIFEILYKVETLIKCLILFYLFFADKKTINPNTLGVIYEEKKNFGRIKKWTIQVANSENKRDF